MTARVSRRRPVSSRVTPADEAAPAQQPAPRRTRRAGSEVGQQQAGEQRQQRRPGEGERSAEAPGGEGEDPGPHAGDQEGVERTERPPPATGPVRAGAGRRAARARRVRRPRPCSGHGRRGEEDRDANPGPASNGAAPGSSARASAPPASAATAPRTTPSSRTGSSSISSRPTAPAGPRPRSRATATSPRRCSVAAASTSQRTNSASTAIGAINSGTVRWACRACSRTSSVTALRSSSDVRGHAPACDVARQLAHAVTERQQLVDAGRPGAEEGACLRGLAGQDRPVDEGLLGRQPGVVGGGGVGAVGDARDAYESLALPPRVVAAA